MKRFIYFAMCVITLSFTSCNNGKTNSELSFKDSLLFEQLNVFQQQLCDDMYKLYPTQNMWTFLKLNTATGQIWIVQWNTEEEKRFTYELDTNIRVIDNATNKTGRFSLLPTENMYNFILLDNINGACWQVQWNFDEEKRFVVPIY